MIRFLAVPVALLMVGCTRDDAREAEPPAAESRVAPQDVTIYGTDADVLPPEELARGRRDPSWRRVVSLDPAAPDSTPNPERFQDITPEAVNTGATHLPLRDDAEGPSVLKAQILLDRALFSPGIIDGMWGKNTEKAVYWFQRREGLPGTGQLDRATFERLATAAGSPREVVLAHRLTEEDVEGPFLTLPEDIYEKAKLHCMCYESLTEKLAERFHTSPEVLAQLNPGVSLDSAQADQTLYVPNVREPEAGRDARIARLVVSDAGYFLHALDAQDRIVFHFPTTLGSDYMPSPDGEYRITNIAPDPSWHYQPELLQGAPEGAEDAMIPPGPNSAVGVVWMALSKPHYGVHGTSAPETIGYTTSSGCVRLTNWDARFLSERIRAGIPVQFRDVDNSGRV